MKNKFVLLIVGVVLSASVIGCSIPTYQKSIITEYDSNGKLIGTTITESIVQSSPQSSPMKVKITQAELEK